MLLSSNFSKVAKNITDFTKSSDRKRCESNTSENMSRLDDKHLSRYMVFQSGARDLTNCAQIILVLGGFTWSRDRLKD